MVYDFRGFRWPVRAPPVVNRARAGRLVLVRFSLHGFHGRDVLAAGYPQVAEIECGAGARARVGRARPRRIGGAALVAAAGASTSSCGRRGARWAGTCRQLLLGLADGTVHRAEYRFKR